MNIFKKIANSLPEIAKIKRLLAGGVHPLSANGISQVHKAMLCLALGDDRTSLIITEDEITARKLCDDINQMAGEKSAYIYPSKEFMFTNIEGMSREYEHTRLETLSKAITGECKFVVASIEAAMQKTIPPKDLQESTISIKTGSEITTNGVAQKLISIGYSRCEKVEGASQFSIRGAILDIFPIQSEFPVRIELWGDEVDSISFFDIETQRRTNQIEEISISPALETLCTLENLSEVVGNLSNSLSNSKHADTIREFLDKDIKKIEADIRPEDTDKFFPLIYNKPATIFDYIDGNIIFNEFPNSAQRGRGVTAQHNEDVKILLDEGILCKGLEGYYLELSEVTSLASLHPIIYMDTFLRGSERTSLKEIISFNALQTSPWSGETRQLTEDLHSFCERGYKTILLSGTEKTLPIIEKDLCDGGIPCHIYKDGEDIPKGTVALMVGNLSGGYEYPQIKSALITQSKLAISRRKVKKRKKSEEIRSLSDITSGDLVVHSLHGIGKYLGIKKLELEGITKDYITIQYAGTDVLYVPVTQLDMVSKYIGPRDDANVKLNKLSSTEWQKTRANVKKAVKDMAEELIKLYAKRQESRGFAFSEDTDWQMDFEERFDYTETDDQLQSIAEIKTDMERIQPMDRLLCGDVGFGKTEVALRAAFKCVMDGKQCAILVPTTVLAWQHYQNALKRFEHFPITIDLLSRFRTPKQQKEILRKLKTGEVNIIIGTHRIVQKDVEFFDLGLAIIDEEQRFGVAHKEKFKKNFVGVDVLTLSATPIPRTLNMAMSGIRDMSVIEEPPQDRYPVQTYVIEHNQGVIIQALAKELKRGGQCYYIHNRVETIQQCAMRIKEALPDARIECAHGKMNETEMSEIWRRLVDREIDILVCTTIIETGVDVSNVNTLIIENADRFGLSQLYQLRGRVGRSNRRAYAYFTFHGGKILTEIATKRLNAIREFTQFGSGFRIALRDLEIRGAGSILGGKQHGHMEAVGYDMYLRLLSEAIAEERGDAPTQKAEDCLVDIQIEAHIPEKYISSQSQRIDIYRKIATISNKEDSMELVDELIDRYGDPPKAILGLIDVALLRNIAQKIGVREISQRGENLLFFIASPSMQQISNLSNQFKGRVLYNSSAKPYISVKLEKKQKSAELIEKVLDVMLEE